MTHSHLYNVMDKLSRHPEHLIQMERTRNVTVVFRLFSQVIPANVKAVT